jgi:hypothetical protein
VVCYGVSKCVLELIARIADVVAGLDSSKEAAEEITPVFQRKSRYYLTT